VEGSCEDGNELSKMLVISLLAERLLALKGLGSMELVVYLTTLSVTQAL
jgi:hypothetical protein